MLMMFFVALFDVNQFVSLQGESPLRVCLYIVYALVQQPRVLLGMARVAGLEV